MATITTWAASVLAALGHLLGLNAGGVWQAEGGGGRARGD